MDEERNLFEKQPENAKRLELLIAATVDYERGHMLLCEVAEAVLNVPWRSNEMRNAINSWRKHLHQERGIETWSVPGVGVKLLPDEEISTVVGQKRTKKAYRQHGLILRAFKNTRMDHLSDHQKRVAIALAKTSEESRKELRHVKGIVQGNITSDRQALIDRAKQIAEEHKKQNPLN